MDVPNSTSETKTAELKGELEAEAKGSMGIPFLSKGEVGAKGTFGGTLGKTAEQVRERRGLPQVVNEIANSDFTILLDDFHYMPREV